MASEIPYDPVAQTPRGLEIPRPRKTRLKPGLRGYWAAWTGNGWLIEIASTVVGILCIVALIVVLRHYDGNQAPQFGSFFGSSLTLNTVIAILSTAAKATLLVPVAECVGQLKWLWFSKHHRPLADMAMFDKGGRGVLGGLMLIWGTKLRTFATVGAVLTVFALAMDPFTQQLVAYTSDRVQAPADGTVPVILAWSEGTEQSGMVVAGTESGGHNYSTISTGMKGAIQTGLYSGNVLVKDVVPFCPSQNCTFTSYSSLAVCSSFANVSSSLYHPPDSTGRISALSSTIYLDDNAQFNASSASVPSKKTAHTTPLFFNHSIAFKDVPLPLADVLMIFATYPDGPYPVYSAVEFILQWCVQEFTTEVLNGTAKTVRHGWTGNFTGPEQAVTLPYATAHVGSTEYSVEEVTHETTSRFLDSLLKGDIRQTFEDGYTGPVYFASSDSAQALAEPYNIWQGPNSPFSFNTSIVGTNQTGLEFLVNNIATSMTNYIRSSSSDVANGDMFTQEIVVKVRWKWIAAHGTFVCLCLLLLLSTIIATHLSALRSYAWKSSTSAVLHALTPSLQQEAKGISTEPETSAFDQDQLVRLWNFGDEGWRLVPQDVKQSDDQGTSASGRDQKNAPIA